MNTLNGRLWLLTERYGNQDVRKEFSLQSRIEFLNLFRSVRKGKPERERRRLL